ncbi:hypothetical protein NL676_011730 [Syzygium grande]|nr:hypothetical protein NL676_011730 [Syzygium grande]
MCKPKLEIYSLTAVSPLPPFCNVLETDAVWNPISSSTPWFSQMVIAKEEDNQPVTTKGEDDTSLGKISHCIFSIQNIPSYEKNAETKRPFSLNFGSSKLTRARCEDDTDDGIMEQSKEVLRSGGSTSAKREICRHHCFNSQTSKMNGPYASRDTDKS